MLKGTRGQRPYSRYLVYKVFHKREGRYFAVLFSIKHRTTIAWAKYVLEVSLRRKLRAGYQAHHKDKDKTNDAIDNLQEKLGREHQREHFDNCKARYVALDCPYCHKEFVVEYNQTHWGKRRGEATHCSRPCATRRKGASSDQKIKRTLFLTKVEYMTLRSSVAAAIGS